MARVKPDSRADYAEFLPITTRWMDNDLYNHVNNVVYYSFFDTAVNEFMVRSGVLDLKGDPVNWLAVETGCNFFKPLSFPDKVQCGLRITQLGRSSVRYELGIFRDGDELAAAQGFFINVACASENHKPISIPPAARAVFERVLRPPKVQP